MTGQGVSVSVKELRREVYQKTLAQWILLVFTQQLKKSDADGMAEMLGHIGDTTAHQLRNARDALDENLRRLLETLGCKLRVPALANEYLRFVKSGQKFVYMHKSDIDNIYFTRYEKAWPGWKTLPPHLLIGLDLAAEFILPGQQEWFLPEAALYEDMCFSLNNAVATSPDNRKSPIDKSKVKAHAFYRRSAVLASFYFVEAYLNGIAFDFALRHGKELSLDELDILREWDSKRGKEKWVKFREKLLQYPKIILQVQHPPLTETNCPELQLIVTEAKEARDSLVHWSPKSGDSTGYASKTSWVLDIKDEKMTRIVDAAVRLVKRLNSEIGQHGYKLHWLHERENSGLFPKEAFL